MAKGAGQATKKRFFFFCGFPNKIKIDLFKAFGYNNIDLKFCHELVNVNSTQPKTYMQVVYYIVSNLYTNYRIV